MKSRKSMGVGAYLSAALLVLFLAEAYYAFNFVYKNFLSTPPPPQTGDVVRLDSKSYRDTITFIDSLNQFIPQNPTPKNPNPFK